MVAPVPRLPRTPPPQPPPCLTDAALRAKGFQIVSRPKCGPALWARRGRGHEPLTEDEAHAVIAGEAVEGGT